MNIEIPELWLVDNSKNFSNYLRHGVNHSRWSIETINGPVQGSIMPFSREGYRSPMDYMSILFRWRAESPKSPDGVVLRTFEFSQHEDGMGYNHMTLHVVDEDAHVYSENSFVSIALPKCVISRYTPEAWKRRKIENQKAGLIRNVCKQWQYRNRTIL